MQNSPVVQNVGFKTNGVFLALPYLQDGLSVSFWDVCSIQLSPSFSRYISKLCLSTSFREKARLIFKATRQHARNLAMFAIIYKTTMLVLRSTSPSGKEASSHTFLAGLLGGYIVFGRSVRKQSSVNQQIVIYVFARVVLGLAKMAVQKGAGMSEEVRTQVSSNAWPVFASLSWAFVMWIYRWHPDTIQPSLRSSMKYMYVSLQFRRLRGLSPLPPTLNLPTSTTLSRRRVRGVFSKDKPNHFRSVDMSMRITGTAFGIS